jgi:hypothetical protein
MTGLAFEAVLAGSQFLAGGGEAPVDDCLLTEDRSERSSKQAVQELEVAWTPSRCRRLGVLTGAGVRQAFDL